MNKNSTHLVKLEQIGLEKLGRCILQNVDLVVTPGEIITIIGPNGAGKTSLLKVMLGLQAQTQGAIRRQAGLVTGYVPQRFHAPSTMPLTVQVFLQLAARCDDDALLACLQEVSLDVPLQQSISTLSGGELQRLLLARALLRKPGLLVLDEPAQGLDFTGEAEFYHLVSEIRDRYGCAVVMVSHDLHLVMAATDQVVCLNTHICCHGQPDSIGQDPEYQRLFGKRLVNEFALYHHDHDHHHAPDGSIIHDHGESADG